MAPKCNFNIALSGEFFELVEGAKLNAEELNIEPQGLIIPLHKRNLKSLEYLLNEVISIWNFANLKKTVEFCS